MRVSCIDKPKGLEKFHVSTQSYNEHTVKDAHNMYVIIMTHNRYRARFYVLCVCKLRALVFIFSYSSISPLGAFIGFTNIMSFGNVPQKSCSTHVITITPTTWSSVHALRGVFRRYNDYTIYISIMV